MSCDLLQHAEDRVADALGLLLEAVEIDVLDPALADDFAHGVFGDDAEPRLRSRQRRLDVQVVAGARSSEKTWRISAVEKMSRKMRESKAVAGISVSGIFIDRTTNSVRSLSSFGERVG
jgi:hypothetical protein